MQPLDILWRFRNIAAHVFFWDRDARLQPSELANIPSPGRAPDEHLVQISPSERAQGSRDFTHDGVSLFRFHVIGTEVFISRFCPSCSRFCLRQLHEFVLFSAFIEPSALEHSFFRSC
jgi:hypothetical protein